MIGKEIQFIYHSGTGNTLLIVKEMIKVFIDAKITIHSYRIDSIKPNKIDPNITIGLAFPVAFQSTFPFIWNFIKEFPQAKGTPVFMVDSMMAFSGAIVGPLKKVLSKKGYNCIGAKEIVMPNNLFRKLNELEKDKRIISNGIKEARLYAELLIKGKSKWGRIPLLSDLLYNLCCNKFIISLINRAYGKKITIDKNKCKKCGLCSKLCPVHNITINNFPQWGNSCEICMRCLSYCPSNAITIPGKTFVQYKTVNVNEIMQINLKCNENQKV